MTKPTPQVIAEAWRLVAWFDWYRSGTSYEFSIAEAADSAAWRMRVSWVVPPSIRHRRLQERAL